MKKTSVMRVALAALVLGLTWALTTPPAARADGGVATFFIAHADTHAEATSADPVPARGTSPVVFELRIRDAGTGEKAGWQAALAIDACEFETPTDSAVALGDMFGASVPVRQILPVQNDIFKIKLGQVMFVGSSKADAGLLATVTLTPKATRSCPSGSAGTASRLSQVTFATTPVTQWVAPGGVTLQFKTRPGYMDRAPSAVTLEQFGATSGTIDGWLIAASVMVAMAGAAGLFRLLRRRAHS